MNAIGLQELVGGALQEKFNKAFEKVVENLQDINTPYKNKREINIKLKFTQNELRDDVSVEVDVTEKLAPQSGMKTGFAIGKDLATGELFAEEYGKQIKGQMTVAEYEKLQQEAMPESGNVIVGNVVDPETGEILEQDTVVDFRKAAQ